MSKLTLARAKELLPKHTTESHLFTHAACVSAAMGAMADYYGEDKDHWEAIGWLHDVDYEQFPSTEARLCADAPGGHGRDERQEL